MIVTGQPVFVVLSREQAKLSYRWTPAVIERPLVVEGRLSKDAAGEPVHRLSCPACELREWNTSFSSIGGYRTGLSSRSW